MSYIFCSNKRKSLKGERKRDSDCYKIFFFFFFRRIKKVFAFRNDSKTYASTLVNSESFLHEFAPSF